MKVLPWMSWACEHNPFDSSTSIVADIQLKELVPLDNIEAHIEDGSRI